VVNGEERLYSQKLACTECSSIQLSRDPSPSTARTALEECHGLAGGPRPRQGHRRSGQAAVRWLPRTGRRSWHLKQQVEELARKNRINLSKPFEALPKKSRDILLNGAAGMPGILATLDQTYQSSTEAYREWLVDYMSPAECPACHGQRLRPASLSVRVKNFAISEFTGLPISRALMTVRNWELNEREGQIAGRVQDEIRRRLEFLSAVGLDYLSLDRSAATLSGGEAQRIRLATQIGSSCAACSTCSTSHPSACACVTTTACSKPSPTCATWATRSWWWSTTPKPSSAPIT
jgi:excinuclease ABC subunit A